MPLAGTADYECAACQGQWTEYYGLMPSDDENQQLDRRLCETCGGLTDCHHPSREAIDPELHDLQGGNMGRMLAYLRGTHELVYDAWSPELGLPSPSKLARICQPLAATGLVELTVDRIALTPEGVERLARLHATYPCGVCGQPYPEVPRCPRCKEPLALVARGCADARMLLT